MRAKKVYENISFNRGRDPYSALDIGVKDVKQLGPLKKRSRHVINRDGQLSISKGYLMWKLLNFIRQKEEAGDPAGYMDMVNFYYGKLKREPWRRSFTRGPWENLSWNYITKDPATKKYTLNSSGKRYLERHSYFDDGKESVYEAQEFERGKEVKDALRIGHWGIKRALLDQPEIEVDTMQGDASREWWENGGLPQEFKDDMGYNESDPLSFKDFVGFDDDYYLEQEAPDWVDYDDFHEDFKPVERMKQKPNTNGWGTFIWQRGRLPDGTQVYHYRDGMTSGYITRKEWLKQDK